MFRHFAPAVFVLALVFGSAAWSQALPTGVSPVFAPTYAGNAVSFGGGSATAANASSLSFGNAANGAVYAQSNVNLPLSGGRSAPLVLRSAPSAANIASAVGRFAAKVTGPLVVGVAIYDLAKELGFGLDNSSGSVVVTKADPLICTVAPCVQWQAKNGSVVVGPFRTTFNAACADAAGYWGSVQPTWSVSVDTCSAGAWQIKAVKPGGGVAYYNGTMNSQTVAPSPAVYVPSTNQEFLDAVAAKSGWPSGSAVGRALSDAVASGEVLPLPAPDSITGPSSVPGTPTTVTNPDGSQVVTTPWTAVLVDGPTVTLTDSTSAVSTSPSGAVTGTSTTSAPSEMPKTCGYPGGPPCKIDETGTPDKKPNEFDSAADAYKAKTDENRTTIAGTGDKPFFQGWNIFFSAPAVVACTPIVMPDFNGASMGSLDPCPVVDGMRYVMGLLWAAGGLFMCLGMIKEVV